MPFFNVWNYLIHFLSFFSTSIACDLPYLSEIIEGGDTYYPHPMSFVFLYTIRALHNPPTLIYSHIRNVFLYTHDKTPDTLDLLHSLIYI